MERSQNEKNLKRQQNETSPEEEALLAWVEEARAWSEARRHNRRVEKERKRAEKKKKGGQEEPEEEEAKEAGMWFAVHDFSAQPTLTCQDFLSRASQLFQTKKYK